MKLQKRRYEDVLILRFVGEFDSFNLPAFSERIDKMIEAGDLRLILDLHLLKFVNSAALGYLIKTRKRVAGMDGELVLARPSKFVRRTLSTLGLDAVFKVFDSVESALLHFKQGLDLGEIKLDAEGDPDEMLTGTTPILFRPGGADDDPEAPNQVGRIVTLYEDGLLFRYESDGAGPNPVLDFLKAGQELKLKFRQPFAVKDHYFEMVGSVVEVTEMEGDKPSLSARVRYGEIKDEDRKHLEQFVRDAEEWRQELGK